MYPTEYSIIHAPMNVAIQAINTDSGSTRTPAWMKPFGVGIHGIFSTNDLPPQTSGIMERAKKDARKTIATEYASPTLLPSLKNSGTKTHPTSGIIHESQGE
jgi:hypothetical protein